MKTSPTGIALIKHFESFRSEPYQCSASKWTIGWGHTRGVTADTKSITMLQADILLACDLSAFERALDELVKVSLLQCEFDALVSFTFNVGINAFQGSTLLRLLNSVSPAAPSEFARWNKAGGKVLAGLTRRRNAEWSMFIGNKVIL